MSPARDRTALVSRLHAAADRLEYAWRDAGLASDFRSRMVLAVLRHLDRYPSANSSDDDCALYACRLLSNFWRRNARRDTARLAARRDRQAEVVSLETLRQECGYEPAIDLYEPLRHDLACGEWGRAIAQELVSQGVAREWAWAFVWRQAGCEWQDVAFLMAERFHRVVTVAQLRQWGSRHFPRLEKHLRQVFTPP